jgi:hypothetical protein
MDVPSIDEWVACFVATQDADPLTAAQAHRWIDERIKINPELLLNVACTIMEGMEYPIAARQMASTAVSFALNPRSERHLAEIRDVWRTRPDLAGQVKECLYMAVLSEDVVIRNRAARAFALVFGIEGEAFAEALDQIYDILGQSADSPLQTAGLLSIFKEILSLRNIGELKSQELLDGYTRLWTCALEYVGSNADVFPLVRLTAAECVRDAIEILPEICMDEKGAPVLGQIQAVLASLRPSLQQPDRILFQCCHRVMFNLIRSYYELAPEFVDIIWQHTTAAIHLADPEQAGYRQCAIYFWKEVASFEQGIAEKPQRDRRQPDHHLIPTAAEHLLPIFFQIMCEVTPDDTDVEDISEKSSGMFATMAIAAFYEAAPGPILMGFIEPTFRENIGSEAWPVRHAALLLLYCISHGKGYPKAYTFVADALQPLFESCRHTDIPRVRETALFVLAMILKAFKGLFGGNPHLGDRGMPADFVQGILDLLRLDENLHPQILARYTLILYYLGQIWDEDFSKFRSPLTQFFDPIVEILKNIMSRPISSEDDMQLYQSAWEALDTMIMHGPDPLRQTDTLKLLFKRTLRQLEATRTMIEMPHVRFGVQANLCSNLASLALQLGSSTNGIVEDELHEAIALVFQVLSQEHALIYEEAVMALAGLYVKLHEKFSADELERMMQIIAHSLINESPGVINSASVLLGDLFHFAGPQLVDHFTEFFGREATLLRTHEDMRVIHPFVVKAIAEMFEGVVRADGNKEVVAAYEQELFDLMKMVRQAPINPMNPSDLQYANNLFEYLAQLYRVFAKLFYPRLTQGATAEEQQQILAREKEYLVEMASFARVLEMLDRSRTTVGGDWKISEYVIHQYVEMVRQFGEHCTRKNNVILNNASVHRVLDIGQLPEQKQHLRRKCKDASVFLKGR